MLRILHGFRVRASRFLELLEGAEFNIYEPGSQKTRPYGWLPRIATISAATTLSRSQSGTVFLLNSTGNANYTIKLPEPERGLHYRFVVRTHSGTGNIIIEPDSRDNQFNGGLASSDLNAGSDAPGGEDQDRLTFVVASARQGDWAEFWSDGTDWYLSGYTGQQAGVVLSS